MNINQPLTVYKASAGSGKTFTLAVEYIKLLIRDPQNYRYILAVTFTNKATEEMKTRILGKLYGIANGLEDSESYLEQVRKAFPKLKDEQIRGRARDALQLLIHHYNYFRVETIDSFFQSILRNLARELGLTANLQVGLNDKEVEHQAVDDIIDNIQQDNDPLLGWIMDFVQMKMDESKNWNVIGQIKEFGANIFKDFYKDHQEELHRIMTDPKFFKAYTGKLRKLKASCDRLMKSYAEEFEAIAKQHGLTDVNFSQGHKNAPGYFERLGKGDYVDDRMPNSYVAKAIADANSMIKKADVGKPESHAIVSEVGHLLQRAEADRKKQVNVVNSVELTLKNINELRLLGRIEEEVRNINTANNNYPLSNTQKLLQDLISGQDSPFIYEKIGGQLHYIMIDEFQDTSTVQWQNFKILVDECISHHAGSLIVGDVKQSIYRWRNGDWRLLQELTDGSDVRINAVSLDTNYRSQRRVIEFNNAFLHRAAEVTVEDAIEELRSYDAAEEIIREARSIVEAYQEVAQKVPESRPEAGSVTIRLLSKDNYEECMVQEVKDTVEHLLSSGAPAKKIAILVRKNKYIELLAQYFQQNAIIVNGERQMVKMVSDEAFRLDASLAVCTIVRAMHVLANPKDRLAVAALVKTYQKVCMSKQMSDTELYLGQDNLFKLLPEDMFIRQEQLRSTPLMDLAERLYQIFELNRLEEQSAYVCAFFDQIAVFLKNHSAGINGFLEEWEDNLCKKSIHSDEIDGIRLLTVHKSKGLEFDHVIIPFCDWEIEKSTDTLWVTPQEAPYNELPVVPVRLQAKKLQQSIYSAEYQSEHIKNLMDNLNILYVAFTRASHNLFVIGKNEKADYPSTIIGKVLDRLNEENTVPVLADMLPDCEMVEDEESRTRTFRYGTLCLVEDEHKEEKTDNVFEQKPEAVKVKIENFDAKANFRQSNASRDFTAPDEEMEQKRRMESYIQTGNVLHSLFATIKTLDDIDDAIARLEFDGVLYDKPMTRQELKRMIDERMQSPQVADWFSPRWKVLNEHNIISYDTHDSKTTNRRPDRVIYNQEEMIVIDFKTGAQRKEHIPQVEQYVRLLREMGYPNVTGCLWYIRPNTVIPVTV